MNHVSQFLFVTSIVIPVSSLPCRSTLGRQNCLQKRKSVDVCARRQFALNFSYNLSSFAPDCHYHAPVLSNRFRTLIKIYEWIEIVQMVSESTHTHTCTNIFIYLSLYNQGWSNIVWMVSLLVQMNLRCKLTMLTPIKHESEPLLNVILMVWQKYLDFLRTFRRPTQALDDDAPSWTRLATKSWHHTYIITSLDILHVLI